MIDSTWPKQVIEDFGGEWDIVDQDDMPPDRSQKCVNCSFVPGSVFTRNGFSNTFSAGNTVYSMFHWLFGDASASGKSFLVWLEAAYGVRMADLSTASISNLFTVSGAFGAVFAPNGSRFFSAHYNTSGVGVDGGKVYGYNVGSDPLFVRPMLTTEVTLSAGAPSAGGKCTVGTRNIAFIMTTRNGYVGRPAPVNTSLVLQPTSVTTTAVNKQFLVTVTPATVWPTWSGTIQIIMTTTVDPSTYYFVPLSILAVPAGGALPVTFTVSISDDDLVIDAGFTDATQYFFLLTQDASGNAPFNPSALFNAGTRMAYVFRSSNYGQGLFISNPNKPQEINASKNLLYLPGQLEVTTGFYKDKTIYMVGPNWTYAVGDTGDVPSTWVAADCVDSSIGTTCPEGVSFDMARGIGWVGHVTGLYRFSGGRYDQMPVSYMNTQVWKRINWPGAISCLRIVDNAVLKTVFVAAPLTAFGTCNTNGTAVTWVSGDEFSPSWRSATTIIISGVSYTMAAGATKTALTLNSSAGVQSGAAFSVFPSYNTDLLAWNYTKGDSFTTIKFSRWYLIGVAPNAIAMVQNWDTKRQELWLGQATAATAPFYRHKNELNANVHRDGSVGIDSVYRTGLFGNNGDGGTKQHHGADFRVRGAGSLGVTAATLDGAQTANLTAITLSTEPGRETFRGMNLISERSYYTVSNDAIVDAYFSLSLLRHYFSPFTRIR